MRALDTNVVVRFLVEDDPDQCDRAGRVIRRATQEDPLFVADVVLCETVWVLSVSYDVSRAEIVRVLSDLLRARQLAFASPDRVARSLAAFADGRGDFADYLIREEGRGAGAVPVLTFDRVLLKEDGFEAP